MSDKNWKAYWAKNIRIITILLVIWALISYGAAIISPQLNNIVIAGFPLGFYMGSQGSLIGFVLIIFYYARYMNKLDDEFHVSDTTVKLTKAEEKAKIRKN